MAHQSLCEVTPKVLPNTETFLHSRVFFVTCVVPALRQIMYSLSVCSDGTTSAGPRSFRQNRPPARTLSLTEIQQSSELHTAKDWN